MRILAIDPGTSESAYVAWKDGAIERLGILPNEDMRALLIERQKFGVLDDVTAIEMVACMGMPVGREVFRTVLWIGRFYEHCSFEPKLIERRVIKIHHCGNVRAKDSNIRRALIDKYGPPGTKKAPGVTYGLKSHLWQAFAIATYISETTLSPTAENLVASLTS